MGWRADARRCHADLTGIGLRVGDELRKRPSRERWMYHDDKGHADDARDRRDITHEIEIDVGIERRIDRILITNQEKRVSIWRRFHDRLRAVVNGVALRATNPIFDDEWLTEPI